MHRISLRLNTLEATATDEAREEPYLWTFFFVIDGEGFRVVFEDFSTANLVGAIRKRTGIGSHGNVTSSMVTGDVVDIPPAVGAFSRDVTPIDAILEQVDPVVVAIAILMEEDNVSDDGAEAGHQALNDALETAINGFLTGLNLISIRAAAQANGTTILEEINVLFAAFRTGLVATLGTTVRNAIVAEQNFLENIWAGIDPDDQIGTPQVQMFSLGQLSPTATEFEMRMTNGAADYLIKGEASARELVDTNPDLSGEVEISCASTINVHPVGNVIRSVGGVHNGRPWIMSRAFATQMEMAGRIAFFVDEGGTRTEVHVVRPADGGEPFLRTDPDTTTTNNLLSLSDCPLFLD